MENKYAKDWTYITYFDDLKEISRSQSIPSELKFEPRSSHWKDREEMTVLFVETSYTLWVSNYSFTNMLRVYKSFNREEPCGGPKAPL